MEDRPERKLKSRKLWHKIPVEFLNLVKFEIKSREPIQLSQESTKVFATKIREVKALMAN